MLFLVESIHDGAHCPGYNREAMKATIDALKRRDEIARQFGVTLHGAYSALPEHREFALVDATSAARIAAFISTLFPVEQAEFNLTALTPADEVIAVGEQMMAAVQD